MPRFFCENILNGYAYISGEDALHISKSLRMKKGEGITICDMNGHDYECVIEDFSDKISCKIISKAKTNSEPDVEVKLFQAMPKSDKLEFIIQKTVELGINEITPFISSRCVSRPDDKSMAKKLERLNKISYSAAKQSGRGIVPLVNTMINFKSAVDEMIKSDIALIFYEGGGQSLNSLFLKNYKSISVMIGSEGGFDKDEVDYAVKNGVKCVGLGPRILRCETAPIAATSIIMNLTENM